MKTKKLNLLLALVIVTIPNLTHADEKEVNLEKKDEIVTYGGYNSLKNSSFAIEIYGSGMGSLNGVRLGRDALLKTLWKSARKSVYDYVKKVFSRNQAGTVYVRNGRYISFSPCTHCPWPSPARNR
ncbi:Uncharacterised protein [Chlamydia trachomatis]|nr:Uncharacterised protein [Chlamydia trachomatis]CRH92200.1 Uncharacterised protein [Chlamydia trachomatis]